ncbi:MAG: DUF2232 domain-containing protein [Alphaproteobacteria bacterium]|nr:DUF2232 domain-containing protein [Alphaproteobacteria bacterium]
MPLKAILNSVLFGIISSIFTIGFKFFGTILIFLSYFSPLPIFITTLYYGIYGTIFSAVISVGIIILITSTPIGIIFFITNIIPSIILLIDKTNNKSTYLNFISKLTLINGFFYVSIMLIYFDKINIIMQNFSDYIREKLGKDIIITTEILDIIPSIIISSWGLILLLNLIIARKILGKYFINYQDRILDLKLQSWLIIIFILFLIPASLLNEDSSRWFRSLALIYAIPITIQGIVVIHTLLKDNKNSAFLIYSFYTLVFFIPFSIPLITATGVLDHIYNFRDLKINHSDID